MVAYFMTFMITFIIRRISGTSSATASRTRQFTMSVSRNYLPQMQEKILKISLIDVLGVPRTNPRARLPGGAPGNEFCADVMSSLPTSGIMTGARQMQTADLQTCTSVGQSSTPVSQPSTPVSQNSTPVRLVRLAISDGNGNTIYNLPVCKLQSANVAPQVPQAGAVFLCLPLHVIS